MSNAQKAAFLELFQPIEGDLYRMAYIYLKNREDSLDCIQEAAFRCYRGFGKLRERKLFKTWATRITINCAEDILRKRHNTVYYDDLPEAEEPSANAEKAVLDRLTLSALFECLTEAERSAVVLRHAMGYEFGEMAEILGVPLGTAKTVFYRAVEKLRRRYSE